MCGIAGYVTLKNWKAATPARGREILGQMAAALVHRGPDDEGFFLESDESVGLAHRRLSIVGIDTGRQPLTNEDGSVVVICNGEFFDHEERRAALEAKGHVFKTKSDSEIVVHLWEEYGEAMFEKLRGQFAFCLWDRKKRVIVLARDRFGIIPLFWTRTANGRLLFASEIKGLLASGEISPEADCTGLDQVFSFCSVPAQRTCFRNVSALLPGHYMKLSPGGEIETRRYWDLDFPDAGDEYDPGRDKLIAEFSERFHHATDLRLRADVPVASYLSGGVDSTTVVAVASKMRDHPIQTFTIEIPSPGLNELSRAKTAADLVGSPQHVITCDPASVANIYPELVLAAESPVMDTSSAALLCLAKEVRRMNIKAVLSGEGADESLAGYSWFKTNRMMNLLDRGSFRPSNGLRYLGGKMMNPSRNWSDMFAYQKITGGPHAITDFYGALSAGRFRFFSPDLWDRLESPMMPYADLDLDLDRMKRWHPLNQSLYFGFKTILPGLLMNHKGDRPAMHSSVEARYPFLDEDVVDFCAKVHPRWKLRGLFRDKHLLREFASGMLPPEITHRRKHIFRAPFAATFFSTPPAFAEQLLSPESLKKTGYFNEETVRRELARYDPKRKERGPRMIIEMALTTVMATQLWHHLFIDGSLCELPAWSAKPVS